jgi:hypothetical protein
MPSPEKNVKRFYASLWIATALLLLASVGHASTRSDDYSESIELAVNRWLLVQRPSGFMPYAFDFIQDREVEPNTMSAVNLVRQAGTASALADYYALTKDRRAAPAIQRYLRAFGHHSLPIGKSRKQALVESTRILSSPYGRYKIRSALHRFGLLYAKEGPGMVISPDGTYRNARTGAVALTLLTEVRYAQTSGDNSFADLRRALVGGLVALRIPGGGFRDNPESIDPLPYFDGESWLALAEYHRAFPQDLHVGEFLIDVENALLKQYGDAKDIAFFHWGTQAAAVRYADTKDKKFLNFIKAQTRAFLDSKKDKDDMHNNCASVEGLADAIGALLSAGEGNGELANRARRWVKKEMHKANQMQIQPGQQELVFTNSRFVAPRMQEFSGCFRMGVYAAYTQVDLTQHCLSAMLKLKRVNETPRVAPNKSQQ